MKYDNQVYSMELLMIPCFDSRPDFEYLRAQMELNWIKAASSITSNEKSLNEKDAYSWYSWNNDQDKLVDDAIKSIRIRTLSFLTTIVLSLLTTAIMFINTQNPWWMVILLIPCLCIFYSGYRQIKMNRKTQELYLQISEYAIEYPFKNRP